MIKVSRLTQPRRGDNALRSDMQVPSREGLLTNESPGNGHEHSLAVQSDGSDVREWPHRHRLKASTSRQP